MTLVSEPDLASEPQNRARERALAIARGRPTPRSSTT